MELVTGIGPVTPTLPRWCSTAEPHQHVLFFDWILRWNWVVKKCCFCFTKATLYRLSHISTNQMFNDFLNVMMKIYFIHLAIFCFFHVKSIKFHQKHEDYINKHHKSQSFLIFLKYELNLILGFSIYYWPRQIFYVILYVWRNEYDGKWVKRCVIKF